MGLLLQFAGFISPRAADVVGVNGIKKSDMISYTYPTDEELATVGVTGIFLGIIYPGTDILML